MRGSFKSLNCRRPQSWTVPRLALAAAGAASAAGFFKKLSEDSQNSVTPYLDTRAPSTPRPRLSWASVAESKDGNPPKQGLKGRSRAERISRKRPASQSWNGFRPALDRAQRAGRAGIFKKLSEDSENKERVRKVQIGCSFKSQTCTRPQSWAASRLALTGAEGAEGAGFFKKLSEDPQNSVTPYPDTGSGNIPAHPDRGLSPLTIADSHAPFPLT